MIEERNSELEGIAIESLKTEKKGERVEEEEKERTEYLMMVGQ
jgi:hypothetical protein